MLSFIFQTPPHIHAKGREGLDAILSTSAYTEQIQLFFVGDGVLQLLKHQNVEQLKTKNYIKAFNLLELYDVENIYICQSSLEKYGYGLEDLVIKAQLLSPQEIADKLSQSSAVLRF